MKKIFKLFLSTCLSLSLMFSLTGLSAYAEDYTAGTTEGEVTVTATVNSSWTVVLPPMLELTETNGDGYNYACTYRCGVKANLESTEMVMIVPRSNFEMKNRNNASIKAIATVTQAKGKWVTNPTASDEIAVSWNDTSYTEGKITVNLTEAGSYTGAVSFTFAKTTRN